MKRLLIASTVGTIILYVWLALAHTVLMFHYSDFKYTPAQDSILTAVSSSLHEDGFYMTPYYNEGTSMKEMEDEMKARIGKPWALINYHSEMEDESAMTFIMSLIYNFISVLIICIALATASSKLASFGQHLWFVMLFAFFPIFSSLLLMYNWEGFPMQFLRGEIIDLIVGYFLTGLWLAWYYRRIESNPSAS